MAQVNGKCGTATVTYDDRCDWSCFCSPGFGCHWRVTCPDGQGGYYESSGDGRESQPPSHPVWTFNGNLDVFAQLLSKEWKRKVIVPERLRGTRIHNKRVEGTPEEIAHALGLELGA
jgi:hypothetical protein